MKPHIICHMLSSIDGRIDGAALKGVSNDDEYETLNDELDGDAWICGRETMQKHFAEKEPFTATSADRIGKPEVYKAKKAESYAISVDTLGKLQWESGDIDGDHLICVVSEAAPADYLPYLRAKSISFIVTGEQEVDLKKAVEILGETFGIRKLLLEGGGHINGAFLAAGLVDEISLLLVAGADGRAGIPTLFDGIDEPGRKATTLKLISVDKREKDALWLRYEVAR